MGFFTDAYDLFVIGIVSTLLKDQWHLGTGGDGARYPGDQRALLGVGRAAGDAEAAIDAGMGAAARRREGGDRGFGPADAHRLAAFDEGQRGGVHLVRAVWVARAARAPGVGDRAGDRQRLLDLAVVAPHLAPVERPVEAVAHLGAGLEPLRAEAQRHHGEVHGAAADRLAAVVGAELDRVVAVTDAVVGPVELGLLALVGGEVLQRAEIWSGVEGDDGEAGLGELAGERAAAGAGADDDEVHPLVLAVFAHRDPAARGEHVRGAALGGARRREGIRRHGGSSCVLPRHRRP